MYRVTQKNKQEIERNLEFKKHNFLLLLLTCHKISDVDSVYWNRRIDDLRNIYNERQQYINPVNGDKRHYNLKEVKGIQDKIKDMDKRIPTIKQIKEIIVETMKELRPQSDTIIVNSEKDIIEYSKQGYSCTPLGNGKWLMKN